MSRLQEALEKGRNGNAILFCGAGLTADCLNFEDESTVGVTIHLLSILNEELKRRGKQNGFRDIRNAAKKFREEIGNHSLMKLLQERFHLSKVSASIVDIVNYPWAAIYTTNYDNGVELAMQTARRKFSSVNNLDDPNSSASGTPVIHLHGCANNWDDRNFLESCVLDTDSYHRLSGVRNWLDKLRFDIERAELVVFVGFSAADFHLSQVFFDASGLKKKAFFINRPSSDPDPDEYATQQDFGEPLYTGREHLGELITEVLKSEAPVEPQLASFSRYLLPLPSASVPPVQDIEDLFIWGKVVPGHLKRDNDISAPDYHVLRDETQQILEHLDHNGSVVLLHGDICEGKTLIVADVVDRCSSARPVFTIRHTYSDVLDEAASILAYYPNAVLVIENCFSLREDRLLGLARQVAASSGGLILTSRTISTEAESGKLRGIRAVPSFKEVQTSRLRPREIGALVALVDQIAGWRNFRALSPAERQRFIEIDCKGVIPSVLLRLFDSEYVREKYREEYNKISFSNANERQMFIAALLIANIGFDAPTSLLSDIFEQDFVSILKRREAESGGLRLLRVERDVVKTVPSIGTRNLLRTIVETRDIVNTTIFILEKMASDIRRTDFEQHLFAQLMRYSILSSIVSDESEIYRFFDHVSKISFFREMPLFWLQWHMAMCASKNWLDAEKYLDMGNTAADALDKRRPEKYNRKQLEDRRAKFLAMRAVAKMRSGTDLFRDIKEALDIVGRLLRDSELTHHPYETLSEIVKSLEVRGNTVLEVQHGLLMSQLDNVFNQAKRRLGVVPEGHQRSQAGNWLSAVLASGLIKTHPM